MASCSWNLGTINIFRGKSIIEWFVYLISPGYWTIQVHIGDSELQILSPWPRKIAKSSPLSLSARVLSLYTYKSGKGSRAKSCWDCCLPAPFFSSESCHFKFLVPSMFPGSSGYFLIKKKYRKKMQYFALISHLLSSLLMCFFLILVIKL